MLRTAALEEIKRTSADALAELRSTLRTLRSAADLAPLRPAQSLADLPDLVDGLAGAGVAVDLRMRGVPHPPDHREPAAERDQGECADHV